ncbi:MAG: hypothetical protein R3C49_28310, partial [Planctomycetaceae bacterium]
GGSLTYRASHLFTATDRRPGSSLTVRSATTSTADGASPFDVQVFSQQTGKRLPVVIADTILFLR